MHNHYFDSELIDLDDNGPWSIFVAEGDAAWTVSYYGNPAHFPDGMAAYHYLKALREHPSTPSVDRPHIKNLARRLWNHVHTGVRA